LFVRVSVPVSVERVTVPVGIVTVPLLLIEVMTGVVNVLFVSVCDPVSVATVESIAIVPDEVIAPPVRPVPAVIDVTVPAPV
jgi:hypothetical protein